jgi:ribonuclease HII
LDGFERRARENGFRVVAGVDEAGRGPLAGPVVAAVVVLPEGFFHKGIRDSKALSPIARKKAFDLIGKAAVSYGVGLATPEEIDKINILKASLLAMRRAVETLPVPPDFLYVDGIHRVPHPVAQEPLVAGDSRCLSIMAASVLAKVTRDGMMAEYDAMYPGYRFAAHKGYPTREHLAALRRLGPCPIHRTTFRGVCR